MLVKMHNELHRVLEVKHVSPGKGRAFVQSRMRNLRAGTLLDHKFRSADTIERVVMDDREMQYTYRDGDTFCFMDLESYEQIEMSGETLGDSVNYLLPEATITVSMFEGQAVGIDLPLTVDLKVEETAPAIKGATASAQLKAGASRNRSGRACAALHQQWRRGAREHRDRRISVTRVAVVTVSTEAGSPWLARARSHSFSTPCSRPPWLCWASGS